MSTRLVPARLPASLCASAALHALGLLLAVRFVGALAVPTGLPRAEVIPVSLVSLIGGGGGPQGDGPPRPAAEPAAVQAPQPGPRPAQPVTKRAATRPAPPLAKAVAKAEVRPSPAPPVTAAPGSAPGADSAGGGTGGTTGGGDGTGGDGSGGARPAYGTNPKPPYPRAALRLGLEGSVTLEVVVRSDGRANSVVVRRSSGHAMLDQSALDTVRDRWRFIPARRGGMPVESTVTVPIRFRLTEG